MKYVPPFNTTDPDAPYVDGNPATGQEGSIPPAASFNEPLTELDNLVTYGGYTPDHLELDQVTRAVRRQWYNFAIDTGSVNNLSVSLQPSPEAYKQGVPLRVLAATTNTGACTINNSGLGVRSIKRPDGSDLVAGDIHAGGVAYLIDDGGHYQLVNYLGATSISSSSTITIKIPYCADTSVVVNQITANYSPAITSLVEGDFLAVKMANTNTGTVTMTVNALTAYPVYRNDGQPVVARDLLKNMALLLEFHGTYFQVVGLVMSQVLLTADLVLYVRTDGNDNHDGSLNDAAHAFRTIAACIAFIKASFLIAGRTVTIQLGNAGTFDRAQVDGMNTGTLVLRGDPANMDLYVIPCGSTTCVGVNTSNLQLAGVTLNMTANNGSNWLQCNAGAQVTLTNCSFKGLQQTPDCSAIASFRGSTVTLFGTIKQQTNMASFAGVAGGSLSVGATGTLIQVVGTPNYSHAFCECGYAGLAVFTVGWVTFSGAATGWRYSVLYNSTINTFGGGPNFLPGNQPGVVSTGGYYI